MLALDKDRKNTTKLSKKGESIAGAIAGGGSRMLVAPLDVLKIRFQLQITNPVKGGGGLAVATPHYTGLIQATRTLIREEGILTLWRGSGAAIVLWVVYLGVQFPLYRMSQAWFGDSFGKSAYSTRSNVSHFLISLFCGGFSGAIATTIAYPWDIARTRLASQGINRYYRGILHSLAVVSYTGKHRLQSAEARNIDYSAIRFNVDSILNCRYWFRGLTASLVGLVPSASMTFAVYELSRRAWDVAIPKMDHSLNKLAAAYRTKSSGGSDSESPPLFHLNNESAKAAASGAIGGFFGKLVVYPLDTVKKRLQVIGMDRPVSQGSAIPHYRGVMHALVKIVRDEGLFRGLYKGIVPSLVKSSAGTAVAFSLYEGAVRMLHNMDMQWAIEEKPLTRA